jgi:hypothetical protein
MQFLLPCPLPWHLQALPIKSLGIDFSSGKSILQSRMGVI